MVGENHRASSKASHPENGQNANGSKDETGKATTGW
jgi:hypothetical protein